MLSFMINFDVATGWVVRPSDGPTRRESDSVAHIQRSLASDPHSDPAAPDIHITDALVRYVAERDAITRNLGINT